jgi:hypothetical protein
VGIRPRQLIGFGHSWQDSRVTNRREAAPNPEWVLMYRGGLTRGQIANLVGAATSTDGYHLTAGRAADPELPAIHKTAAAAKTTHAASKAGLEHMRELAVFVKEAGRYPSRASFDEPERSLAAWLQRRREEARDGTLAHAYREGLDALTGWQSPSLAQADHAWWEERLAALVDYRAAGNDWPRHKAFVDGPEHGLGVWLHYQRAKLHRGELDEAKVKELDRVLPGWQEGRRRGRNARP